MIHLHILCEILGTPQDAELFPDAEGGKNEI
jgi:hypothetical protein